MLIALTPILPGTILQPLPIPRVVSEMAAIVAGREVNINMNRAKLQHLWLEHYYPLYEFALLIDSDVIMPSGGIDALMKAWKPGTTPCIKTKGVPTGHVVTACALIHRDDYRNVNYLERPFECQCLKLPKPFYIDNIVGKEINNG